MWCQISSLFKKNLGALFWYIEIDITVIASDVMIPDKASNKLYAEELERNV